MLLSLAPAVLAVASLPPPAAVLLGDWVTLRKDVVEIYNCDSHLCLRIVYVNPAEGHTTDGQNPDPSKRDRPLCGLVIGSGFSIKNDSVADGGKLYDPESGHTYSGTITSTSSSTLRLHGYMGISLFGRTEDWTRAPSAPAPCK